MHSPRNAFVLDFAEFITLYNTLLHQQQNGNSNPCKSANACGYGEACYLCKTQSRGYCCKKIMTGSLFVHPSGLPHNCSVILTLFLPTRNSGSSPKAKRRTHKDRDGSRDQSLPSNQHPQEYKERQRAPRVLNLRRTVLLLQ